MRCEYIPLDTNQHKSFKKDNDSEFFICNFLMRISYEISRYGDLSRFRQLTYEIQRRFNERTQLHRK